MQLWWNLVISQSSMDQLGYQFNWSLSTLNIDCDSSRPVYQCTHFLHH